MLLTITSTNPLATDLGYLHHKNPSRHQSFELPFGLAHVFYPEGSDGRRTAAMLLEVDPVGLVGGEGRSLTRYGSRKIAHFTIPATADANMSVADDPCPLNPPNRL